MRVLLFSLLALFSVATSNAQFFSKKKKKTTSSKTSKKALHNISQKTKGMKKEEGLFDLFRDTVSGELWLKIDSTDLGKEFIHFTYTENGVISAGHHRGSYRGSRIFKILRRYKRLDFIQQNTQFYFDPSKEISKSSDANISQAILASEDIVAEEKG